MHQLPSIGYVFLLSVLWSFFLHQLDLWQKCYTVVGYSVSYRTSAFSDIVLAAWNWPGEVYLHHGNQQML